jgi:hypothetical protein
MAAIVAVSLLVLGACSTKEQVDTSSGSSASSQASSTSAAENTTTTKARAATAAEAEAMLLTLGDLPPGWSNGGIPDDDTTAADDDDTDSFFCPAAEAQVPDGGDDDDDVPTAQFSQGTLGPFLMQIVAPGTPTDYDTLTNALDSCIGDTWTSTDDDGTETQYTMAELSAEKLGDESKAYRISGVTEGGTLTIDTVVGRTDRVVSAIFGMSIETIVGGGSLDSAGFASIVHTASGKLS